MSTTTNCNVGKQLTTALEKYGTEGISMMLRTLAAAERKRGNASPERYNIILTMADDLQSALESIINTSEPHAEIVGDKVILVMRTREDATHLLGHLIDSQEIEHEGEVEDNDESHYARDGIIDALKPVVTLS